MTNEEVINKIKDVLGSTLLYDDSIDYQLNTDDVEWLEKAKATLEKQINNPLTLDEVKELKEGDVVWMKDNWGVQVVKFAEVVGDFFTFFTFGSEMTCQRFLSSLNYVYTIYRNKPDHIADVSKRSNIIKELFYLQ